jgi:DNA-directed RNA polymerase subunit RPC12/RpoP
MKKTEKEAMSRGLKRPGVKPNGKGGVVRMSAAEWEEKHGAIRCADCGTQHELGNGQLATLSRGRATALTYCPNCGMKTWSRPFAFPMPTHKHDEPQRDCGAPGL